jgi:hypothetical protein
MVDMNDLVNFVVLVTLAALIAGATSLSLDAFQDTNSDNSATCNTTTGANCSASYNVTGEGLASTMNVTDQLPTIGTILGVAVLIGIVIAAFRFARN